MTPLRSWTSLPEDECDVRGQPTMFGKVSLMTTWKRYCRQFVPFRFLPRKDFSRSEPQKSETFIRTSRSLSSYVCVFKMYFSLVYFYAGWAKVQRPDFRSADFTWSSRSSLQFWSDGICCSNQPWCKCWINCFHMGPVLKHSHFACV